MKSPRKHASLAPSPGATARLAHQSRPLAAGITLALGLMVSSAQAVTINVDSVDDTENDLDGLCTLREAIASANSKSSSPNVGECETGSGTDILDLSAIANNTVTLTAGALEIDANIDVTVAGNNATVTADTNSRVFYAKPDSALSLQNLTVTGGATKDQGAGIFAYRATLSLSGCTVSNNTSYYSGGGVRAINSTVTITGSVLTGNATESADSYGGGLAISFGTLELSGSQISSNTTQRSGGGMFIIGTDNTISNVTVQQNQARAAGGIYLIGAPDFYPTTNDLSNVTLTRNTATAGQGGGLVLIQATATITGGTINGNDAAGSGGGLYMKVGGQYDTYLSVVSMSGTQISENKSGKYGGGIYSDRSDLDLTGVRIANNEAIKEGGGIFTLGGTLDIIEGYTNGNEAVVYQGGAMRLKNGTEATITRSTVSGNSAGVVSGISVVQSTLVVEDSTLSGNSTKHYSGALDINGSTVTLDNSTISGNTAGTYGSAISFGNNGVLNLEHSTVVSPSGPGIAKSMVFYGDGTLNMTNSILFSDVSTTDCEVYGGATVTINTYGNNWVGNTDDCPWPGGELNGDPALGPLADNGGDTETHFPLPGSPVIDVGDSSLVPQPTMFDQRGAPFGRNNGQATELGAVEINGGLLKIDQQFVMVDEDAGVAEVTITRINQSEGAVFGTLNTLDDEAMAPGDYTAIANGTVNWADGELGDKTVQVTIIDDNDDEPDEDLTLRLTGPTGGAGLAGSVELINTLIRIQDNDAPAVPGTLAISPVDLAVVENGISANFEITRTGGSDGKVTVTVNTADGTAEAGMDFTAITDLVVEFDDGDDISKQVNVLITDDGEVETMENFSVNLSAVTGGATLGDDTATAEIIDNDADELFKDGFEEPSP